MKNRKHTKNKILFTRNQIKLLKIRTITYSLGIKNLVIQLDIKYLMNKLVLKSRESLNFLRRVYTIRRIVESNNALLHFSNKIHLVGGKKAFRSEEQSFLGMFYPYPIG